MVACGVPRRLCWWFASMQNLRWRCGFILFECQPMACDGDPVLECLLGWLDLHLFDSLDSVAFTSLTGFHWLDLTWLDLTCLDLTWLDLTWLDWLHCTDLIRLTWPHWSDFTDLTLLTRLHWPALTDLRNAVLRCQTRLDAGIRYQMLLDAIRRWWATLLHVIRR